MATLKDFRLRRFWTQKQLAEAIGVPYQTVQRWEVGQRSPRPGNIGRLAQALQVSAEELLAAIDEARGGRRMA